MSPLTPTAHCSYCSQDVLLRRKEINICLAFFLLFTVFGIFIYLWLYYKNPIYLCVHCGSFIPISTTHYVAREELDSLSTSKQKNLISGEKANYCDFCGMQLDDRTASHCPSCGTKV